MIEIDIKDKGIDDYGPKVRAAVMRYLKDGAQAGQNVALEEVPEDRGTLRKSLAQFVPQERDGSIVYGVGAVPQALPMEYGTDPYQPPIKPLLEWSKRVTGDEGLGWYVATVKIPEEGIDAQPYLRPGAEAQREWLRNHDVSEYIQDID
jgi:hypothetical protein|uniref:Hypothetical Zn-finger domain protein n=1 Tax=uncultured virus TaxID=340016 RepID=D5L2M7_9VIRU|nr:hypothetical Zn-finger domain protein [uncultured virus]